MFSANATKTAIGIVYAYQTSQPSGSSYSVAFDFGVPYFAVALSLNVILTLMIVGRLILHSRNVRNVIGASDGVRGLYSAVVAMLIESCAIYAASSLLFMVPWWIESSVTGFFWQIINEAQAGFVF